MSMEEKQNLPTFQDSDLVYPKSEKEVADLIKQFYKSNTPIEIIGSGSKRSIGKPLQCAQTLSLSKLSGIIEYLPEELYIKVKAGISQVVAEGPQHPIIARAVFKRIAVVDADKKILDKAVAFELFTREEVDAI